MVDFEKEMDALSSEFLVYVWAYMNEHTYIQINTGVGKSSFTDVSLWNTVYSCSITHYYIIYLYYNTKPTFAHTYTVWNWDSAEHRWEQWVLQNYNDEAKYEQHQKELVFTHRFFNE